MLKASLTALALAGLIAAAPSFAAPLVPKPPAAAAPAAAAPAAPAAPKVMDDAKKMKSKQCSADADKKGLHGKARKKFREDCKKAA